MVQRENYLSRKTKGYHYILNEADKEIETLLLFLVLSIYNIAYTSLVKIVISHSFDENLFSKIFLYAI